ncbi:MAG: hypothetical protein QXD23_01245 [Candidatus Micrarchaeaceae archaeon]
MDKRIVIIGVVLSILSFLIAGSVIGPSITSQINYNNTQINKIIVAPNTTVTDTIQIFNESFFVLSYTSTVPINFYLLNKTGKDYSNIYTANKNQIDNNQTIKLEGKGLYVWIQNATEGTTYPYNSNLSSYGYKKPTYFYNGTHNNQQNLEYQNGTYYLEFYNKNVTYANITYKYYEYPFSSLNQSSVYYSNVFVPGSLVSSIMFIIGILLIVFGLLRKRYDKTEQQNFDQKINDIYKKIDKNSKRKSINNKKYKKRKNKGNLK